MLLLWLLVCVLIFWFYKIAIAERHLKQFLGPTPWPLIGSALEFTSRQKTFNTLNKYCERYKKNFRLYFGLNPMLVVVEPAIVEHLLSAYLTTSKQKRPNQYSFFGKWLGNGLLVSDGEYWKRHRAIITPAFHVKILERYIKTFDSVTNNLIKKLESYTDEIVDMYPLMDLTALDIICETAMMTPVNALTDKDSAYVRAVKDMGAIVVERVFSIIQSNDVLYAYTNNAKKETEMVNILHDYTKSVIQKRKTELLKLDSEVISKESNRRQSFLDLLLSYAKQENLTDQEIQEEVDMFMFAGHDTTSTTLACALYSISKDERIQNKILNELDAIFVDDPNRATTYQDLLDMKYLDLVIKETLRLYPPVFVIGRELTESTIIEDKLYPKGISILIYIYGMHRLEEYFENAKVFYPERFSMENVSKAGGRFAYIPFSGGPRNCIGQKFAMLEMKTVLSKILRTYKLSPVKGHKLELGIRGPLKPENGTPVILTKRNKI